MKKLIIAVILSLLSSTSYADTVSSGLRWNIDTDGLEIIETFIGYKMRFEQGEFIAGEIGQTNFSDDDGDRDFNFISLLGQKNLMLDTYGFGSVRLNKGDDFDSFTGNAFLTKELERWRVEVFVERSMIESQLAMDEEIMWNTYGIGVDYIINETFTAVGTYSLTDSSDGNQRNTEEIGLVYSPRWAEKFYAKLRAKWMQSDYDPEEYFSPEEYAKYDVLFAYTTGFMDDKGFFRVHIAPGWQIIDGEGEFAYEYRVSSTYAFTAKWEVEAFVAGVNDEGTENYRYNWGGVQLNYNF